MVVDISLFLEGLLGQSKFYGEMIENPKNDRIINRKLWSQQNSIQKSYQKRIIFLQALDKRLFKEIMQINLQVDSIK